MSHPRIDQDEASLLRREAHQAMLDNGFQPDFSESAMAQARASADTPPAADGVRDLRQLLWSSIDNDDTKDLDQLEYAERVADGATRILIAVADVDATVPKDSPIDEHASANTTSVYTGVATFAMLPERLSTDLTSLREGVDRAAVVISFVVAPDGTTSAHEVYRALVHNRGQLAYNSAGAWLEAKGPAPAKVAASTELQEQLRMQNDAAQAMRKHRHEAGALDLETIEATPVMAGGKVVELALTLKSKARELIEDFMIGANGAMAGFLEARGVSSIRRVVKTPERWNRIVALAVALGDTLPEVADARALNDFLDRRRATDPDHFPDLSLSVVKLMGPGEYALEKPGEHGVGHFGLAVQDYTHSTAPNRRFADLVTQRLVKATMSGVAAPYSDTDLAEIAGRCTLKENDARKVERLMRKKAAAAMLDDQIGKSFDAIVTGASDKGTYVRLIAPPVEGRVVKNFRGLDVGDRTTVKLIGVNERKGFIDFERRL
ncbi:MAG: RNB domain-containing ribonuclease [Gemmatimonadota bacterium]|nr:RNB domain-containing ribonuclease [Gemmatimonadota bacterium]